MSDRAQRFANAALSVDGQVPEQAAVTIDDGLLTPVARRAHWRVAAEDPAVRRWVEDWRIPALAKVPDRASSGHGLINELDP